MADENVSIAIRLKDAAKFAADARRAAREIDELGDATQRADRKAKRAGTSLNLVQRTIRLVKPAALIAALGYLTQNLSAAAAGAVGLTSALAPLGGLLLTIPAFALLAGQGIGVLGLSMMGVAGAVGGLNSQLDPKKFAQLQRPAQDFALTLDNAKKPLIALQNAMQGALFPGLTAGLKAALPAVKALTGPLTATAGVFGSLGERLGRLVGSGGFLRDLTSQARFNNTQISRLGGAGLNLVQVLRHLGVAARPLIGWLVQLVSGWAAGAARAARLGREGGGLRRMFHSVQVTLSRVVRIGEDLAVTLFNIGRIGKRELGDSLLVSLVKGAQSLRNWSKSSRGIKQITTYFQQAKPVVYAVGRLVRDISLAFLGFGAGGNSMAGLIDQLRTQLLPILVDVTQSTTTAFGPHFIDAIVSLAKAFQGLTGASGPLVLYVDTLNLLGRALLFVEQNVPGGAQALSVLFGALAVGKTLQFASALTGLKSLVTGVKKARAAFQVFQGTTTGVRIGLGLLAIQESATGVAAAGMWAAITGPIALAVLAVAALAGAFYLAYTRVQWFHDFVNAHWPLLLGIMTGGVGIAVGYIIKNFDSIVAFITSMPSRIASAATGMFDGIKNAFRSVVNWIIGGWNRLQLKIGGVKIDPPGPGSITIPGVTLNTPDIPLLAQGGMVRTAGSFIVGDAGPEMFTMLPGMSAARVDPLPVPHVSLPTVRQQSGAGRVGGQPIHLHIRSIVQLPDGQILGEATNQTVARQEALA